MIRCWVVNKPVITQPEFHVRRTTAARMLDVTPRTVRRYEDEGKLTPIKRNSRMVCYDVEEVKKLQRGETK